MSTMRSIHVLTQTKRSGALAEILMVLKSAENIPLKIILVLYDLSEAGRRIYRSPRVPVTGIFIGFSVGNLSLCFCVVRIFERRTLI